MNGNEPNAAVNCTSTVCIYTMVKQYEAVSGVGMGLTALPVAHIYKVYSVLLYVARTQLSQHFTNT